MNQPPSANRIGAVQANSPPPSDDDSPLPLVTVDSMPPPSDNNLPLPLAAGNSTQPPGSEELNLEMQSEVVIPIINVHSSSVDEESDIIKWSLSDLESPPSSPSSNERSSYILVSQSASSGGGSAKPRINAEAAVDDNSFATAGKTEATDNVAAAVNCPDDEAESLSATEPNTSRKRSASAPEDDPSSESSSDESSDCPTVTYKVSRRDLIRLLEYINVAINTKLSQAQGKK